MTNEKAKGITKRSTSYGGETSSFAVFLGNVYHQAFHLLPDTDKFIVAYGLPLIRHGEKATRNTILHLLKLQNTLNNQELFSLTGKTALVTGASKGIGKALALGLAQAGADVVCACSQAGGAADTLNGIIKHGQQSWELTGDLSTREVSNNLWQRAADKAARPIDILVNNAGTIARHPAAIFGDEAWDKVMEVNLNAAFVLCRAAGKQMIDEGRPGKIINIASLLSFSGGITVPAYTASKHGIAGITKALANEWAAHNIQVNAIAPGYITTDNTAALREDEARAAAISGRIPAGRWGKPEDLIGAVVFLASNASNYVNGHLLTVDGGWMAR